MKKYVDWTALFSQSGTEILEVSRWLGRFPDRIVTNKLPEDIVSVNPELLECMFDRFVYVPKKPTVEEYTTAFRHTNIVTLHGYLRILPAQICYRYNIYNGHPALISTYPELKGKDPQKRIWENYSKYNLHGHTIHKVITEVDAGSIICEERFSCTNITNFYTFEEYCNTLRNSGIRNWVEFLKKPVKTVLF
jgi:methionyl-tRNA formyltransferase